jgi:hypothetical protein
MVAEGKTMNRMKNYDTIQSICVGAAVVAALIFDRAGGSLKLAAGIIGIFAGLLAVTVHFYVQFSPQPVEALSEEKVGSIPDEAFLLASSLLPPPQQASHFAYRPSALSAGPAQQYFAVLGQNQPYDALFPVLSPAGTWRMEGLGGGPASALSRLAQASLASQPVDLLEPPTRANTTTFAALREQ